MCSELKAIIQSLSPFGRVSLLVIGAFLQIPSVNQKKKGCSWKQVRDCIGLMVVEKT